MGLCSSTSYTKYCRVSTHALTIIANLQNAFPNPQKPPLVSIHSPVQHSFIPYNLGKLHALSAQSLSTRQSALLSTLSYQQNTYEVCATTITEPQSAISSPPIISNIPSTAFRTLLAAPSFLPSSPSELRSFSSMFPSC